LTGPWAPNEVKALEAFWHAALVKSFEEVGFKPEYIQELIKGVDMYVPSNPHQAYKYGVKQATEPIIVSNLADQYVNEVFTDRRKSLLTKKVTKWVAVGLSPSNGKYYSAGYFQDTKEQAIANTSGDPNSSDWTGVFPIEIEVPL